MSEHAHEDHSSHYKKVWVILLALLVISVVGPMLGHRVVTLITAFGIAVVKAYLVAKNFMHINLEKRFVPYIVATCLVFMFLFFAGTAPDVMKASGTGWEKPTWIQDLEAAASAEPYEEFGEGEAAHH